MHCPKCGQQHVSGTEHLRPLPLWWLGDGKKFCSRCGFPLELVAELLDNGGFSRRFAELDKKKTFFTRKNGVVFSVFWMILLMALIPAVIGIGSGPGEAQGISAVIGLVGGLMIMIGSLVFLPSSEQDLFFIVQQMESPPATTRGLHGAQQPALPPQQSIPASVHIPPRAGMWRDTNDLETSTFTENTTRPLKNEERH